GPHPHRLGHLLAPDVEVAVLQPDLLRDAGVALDRERQRRGLAEHLDRVGHHLDLAGGQVGVLVALGAHADLADHFHAVFGAQVVGVVLLAEDHLRRAGGVAQVDEDHPAVVTAAGHPACERHLLPGVLLAERPGRMRADHCTSPFKTSTTRASGTSVCSAVVRSFTWAAPAARSRSPRISAYGAPERPAPCIAPLSPSPPKAMSPRTPASRSSSTSRNMRRPASAPSP